MFASLSPSPLFLLFFYLILIILMFLCICLAFYFYGDFVLSVFVFFFLRLLSCIFLSIFFLFLFDVGSFLFFIFVLSECWVFMVLCVLLPACPLVVAFAFVGLILWSCCSQGSVPMQFRCPHLFQPFLFWWWSLRYLFLRPAPLVSCALFGCIVFCFLPFSWPVCCFVIIPRYIFTRLLYLGLTFFGILLVARYFIFYYLPGCKFHIFPIDLLTQGSSGCVVTQYYSSICMYASVAIHQFSTLIP